MWTALAGSLVLIVYVALRDDKSIELSVEAASIPTQDVISKTDIPYKQYTPQVSQSSAQVETELEDEIPTLLESTLERAHAEGYGTTPEITEVNPQVNSVREALLSKQHPERLSPMIQPKVFDADKYINDPAYKKQYLNTAEPGRVFQSLSPAEGIPKSVADSPYYQTVEQGDTVTLTIKTAPNAPVIFNSFDLGKFDNGLTTQTIESDSKGFASVTFHGMSGTIADVNILASSPMAAGQVKFLVFTKFNNNNDK